MSARAWGKAAPRPNYGRAVAIVGFASAFTALGLVLTRVYWSRTMFAVTIAVWLVLALTHRAVLRRRPWTEQMVIITGEKQLAEDIRNTRHADVIAVFEAGEEPPDEPLSNGVSVVVDLRSVLSESMAQFVSSASIAGYRVRSLTEAYEEHTGRLPMVHLAEGWELTQPVARSSYAPAKHAIDFVLTVITAPLWLVLGEGMVGLAVAAPVEPMPGHLARRRLQRCHPAQVSEGGFAPQPLWVVPGGYQEDGGVVDADPVKTQQVGGSRLDEGTLQGAELLDLDLEELHPLSGFDVDVADSPV
jgi:hypothetical protein